MNEPENVHKLKKVHKEFPGGEDSVLPMQRMRVWPLDQKTRSHRPQLKIPHAARKIEDS